VIESALHRLLNAHCISVDSVLRTEAINNGLIGSHYGITYSTMELFHSAASKLRAKRTRIRLHHILSVLSYGTEFDRRIKLRKRDQNTLRNIARHLGATLNAVNVAGGDDLESQSQSAGDRLSTAKAVSVLLRTHLLRLPLFKWPSIERGREVVLVECVRLLYAIIDIMGTLEMLSGVLVAMELTQMVVQAVSIEDSYLLQLPHVTEQAATTLTTKYNVRSIYDLLDMDPVPRSQALNAVEIYDLDDVAVAANRYPDMDLTHRVLTHSFSDSDGDGDGDALSLSVIIEHDDQDDDQRHQQRQPLSIPSTKKRAVPMAICPRYPLRKKQAWFLILGHPDTDKLLFIKRFTMNSDTKTFRIPLPTDYGHGQKQSGKLKLFLLSDCYRGCDQFADIDLDAVQRERAAADGDGDGGDIDVDGGGGAGNPHDDDDQNMKEQK